MGRTGSDLIKATRPYGKEDLATTWRLYSVTVLATIVAAFIAWYPPLGPARYLGSVLLGLLIIRHFIFFHDAFHGAIFRKSKLGKALMELTGWMVLTPRKVWRDSHNYHHAHTSKMVGSSIGSFPLLSVRMYKSARRGHRLAYRLSRHWLTIAFGYVTVFLYGMCLKPLIMRPKRYWRAIPMLFVHYGVFAAIVYFGGWGAGLRLFVIPMMLSMAMGSYLFYAQHTFEGMKLRNRKDWDYTAAALESSSMMEMSRLMHWFTGNIGYHHVHHLNPVIPFYRLPEVMAAIPELQQTAVTTLKPKDILHCLRLHLWDPEQQTMLTWREALDS